MPSPPPPWSPLLRFSLTRWRGWLLIAAATLLGSGVAVLQPWPMQQLLDSVFGHAPLSPWIARLTAGNLSAAVTVLAAAQLVLVAADLVLVVALSHWWITVGQQLVYDLTRALFANAQRRSLTYHSNGKVGDLISRITGDSWSIYNLAASLIFTPAHALLMTLLMATVLWRLHPRLTLLSLTVAPVLAAGTVVLGRFTRGAAATQRDSEAGIESHVQQTLSGIPVVQSFAQEDRQHRHFVEMAGAAVAAQRRAAVVSGVSNLFSGTLSAAGTAVVLYVAAKQVVAKKLTAGEMVVFLAYLGAMHGQLLVLAHTWIGGQGTAAGVARIRDLLLTRPEIADPPDPVPFAPAPAGCDVVFKDVWFAYADGVPVLRGVNFHARAGETVAVVGESGAGKSTLAALLLRLFDPAAGRVFVDGTDARFYTLADLRHNVAAVLQEPFLTAASVTENVAFGMTDADVPAAAATAAAADFISRLDHGYDTLLGEAGTTLSGGERQRLAIARALVRNAPVLVLDEPSSALDSITEAAVLDNLSRQRPRTMLLITHRLTTARAADKIIFLQNGVVAETGTHDQLLDRGGPYARLWDLQHAGQLPVGEPA